MGTPTESIQLGNKEQALFCYLCKKSEYDVFELIKEGDRYVCDSCLKNR